MSRSQYTSGLDPSVTADIANSQSLSSAIDLGGGSLVGVQFPSAFTGTAITFQVSVDGTTYVNMLKSDASTEYSIAVTVSRFVPVPPADFAGIRYLKVRSGTGSSPTSEGGARSIMLAVRPV